MRKYLTIEYCRTDWEPSYEMLVGFNLMKCKDKGLEID